MKITIKTIKGEVFPIEVEASNKISEVKQKLQDEKGLDASAQKLILRGKNAEDGSTLEELGVKEGDFMVVMVSKKPAAQPQAQPTQPEKKEPETQSTTQTQAQPTTQTQPQAQPTGQAQGSQPAGGDSSLLFGDALNKTISDICEMGFEREQVVKAMKAAYNNADRAIEYLFNGIPEQHELPPQAAGGQAGHGGAGLGGAGAGAGAGVGAGVGGGDPNQVLENLRHDPSFQQIRAVIRNNPQMLQSILSVIAQNNPQLFQTITQNQEAFTKLLLEGDGGEGEGGAPGGHGGFGGQQVIQVTAEEKAAIDRLCSLGFDRSLVIEAYFACDKDESLAANYLLERQMDDLGGDGGQSGSHAGDDYDDDNLFNH